jgi:endonuclease/exonuclease/phosphatase family metal-dependent hydrolase
MKWWFALLLLSSHLAAAPFTVATYNLEFYIDEPALGVAPKTPQSRQLIREAIRSMNPDVLALQEMGSTNALEELRGALREEGLEYRHFEWIRSGDNTLHLAFLSKLPITARRPHVQENFLHQGRRFRVARGFGEIEVAFGKERITLITAHLKSRRQIAEADQQALREAESLLLREKVDEFFRRDPRGNLIVLGDLNDHIASRTLRNVLGRGRTKLYDARPAERNGDTLAHPTNAAFEPRRVVWTHYYGKEETYSRVDYILLSSNLKEAVNPAGTYVFAMPNWGAASDHRPVCLRLDL